MLKEQKGITLVALVVTIIILIILAAVSITLVLNDNGLIPKAQEAAQNYQAAANEEKDLFNTALNYIENSTTTPAE